MKTNDLKKGEDMSCETGRLMFYLNRDGQEAMRAQAGSLMRIYRKAVLCSAKRVKDRKHVHFASTVEFRRGFIESYLEFKHTYLTGEIR